MGKREKLTFELLHSSDEEVKVILSIKPKDH